VKWIGAGIGAVVLFFLAVHLLPTPPVPNVPAPPAQPQVVSATVPSATPTAPVTEAKPATAHVKPAAWTSQEKYLYLYHHYADFSLAQCRLLPQAYTGACLQGAAAQIAAGVHDGVAQRMQLFWEYRHGTAFSHQGCTLLPTDSVAACQARYPARGRLSLTPRSPRRPAPAVHTGPRPAPPRAPRRQPALPVPPRRPPAPQRTPAPAPLHPASPVGPRAPAPLHCTGVSATSCTTAGAPLLPSPSFTIALGPTHLTPAGDAVEMQLLGTAGLTGASATVDWGDGSVPSSMGVGSGGELAALHLYPLALHPVGYIVQVHLEVPGHPPRAASRIVDVPAAACFTLEATARCGQVSTVEQDSLPSSLGAAGAACATGFLQSPVGCLLADGSAAVDAPRGDAPAGTYYAWLATGDLFTCPLASAPTSAAGCSFRFRTEADTGWDMRGTFPASAQTTATACLPPLTAAEQDGRVAVTIGLGLAVGGYRPESAIIDTGSPSTYMAQSTLDGTAFVPAGPVTQILFPLVHNLTVPAQPYIGPLAVRDGAVWAPLGKVLVQAYQSPTIVREVGNGGNGLGLNALQRVTLSVHGSSWTLRFPCGGA
jgi:hypothetical protein